MANPGETNPDPTALLAAIGHLAQGIERLQRSINEQRPEADSLATAVERVVSRTEGMVGTVRALHEQSERASAEFDSLRAEQAALARAIGEDEGRLAAIERQQRLAQDGISRLADLELRLGALEAEGAGGRPVGRPAGNEDEAPVAPGASGVQDSELRRAIEALLAGRPPESLERSAVSSPSAGDLSRRVQRLERRDAAVTSLLELVIERGRAIIGQDIDRG